MTRQKADEILERLDQRGFDSSYAEDGPDPDGIIVRCSQCEALVVNGIATHERGCPNNRREVDD